MKLSLALSALIASTFAPTAIKAECINLLDNSGFELFTEEAEGTDPAPIGWFQGSLPGAWAENNCAAFNDNFSGSGIPDPIRFNFAAGGGPLRNAIDGDWDLVSYVDDQSSNTCRVGQVVTLPSFPIDSAQFRFSVRSFSNDHVGDGGNSGASLICIQSPIEFPQDQLVYTTEGDNNIPGPQNNVQDVTNLLQQAQTAGDETATVYLDSRSQDFGFYQATFWDNVELWVCPAGSGVSGDPHFKSWSGEWFDFHGICDMKLVSSPQFADGLGLDIQIRSKPRYEYSFIETTAIKIGDDILEVGSWGEYFYNGVDSADLGSKMMGGKFRVSHTLLSQKHSKFEIHIGGGESIVVKSFKDMVNVNVEAPSEDNFANSVGLLGSFPEGKLLARDGATIMDDHLLYGQEWQLLEDETSLFMSRSEHAGACAPPAAKEGRHLGESAISEEAAESACAHFSGGKFDACVMDVMASADLEVAEMYGAF